MLSKLIWFLILLGGGFALVAYTEPIKRFVGDIGFAERWFGMGGTYSFLKLLGVAVLIFSILYITGTTDRLVPDFLVSPAVITE